MFMMFFSQDGLSIITENRGRQKRVVKVYSINHYASAINAGQRFEIFNLDLIRDMDKINKLEKVLSMIK